MSLLWFEFDEIYLKLWSRHSMSNWITIVDSEIYLLRNCWTVYLYIPSTWRDADTKDNCAKCTLCFTYGSETTSVWFLCAIAFYYWEKIAFVLLHFHPNTAHEKTKYASQMRHPNCISYPDTSEEKRIGSAILHSQEFGLSVENQTKSVMNEIRCEMEMNRPRLL